MTNYPIPYVEPAAVEHCDCPAKLCRPPLSIYIVELFFLFLKLYVKIVF